VLSRSVAIGLTVLNRMVVNFVVEYGRHTPKSTGHGIFFAGSVDEG
jgi:hypothetical protein